MCYPEKCDGFHAKQAAGQQSVLQKNNIMTIVWRHHHLIGFLITSIIAHMIEALKGLCFRAL